MLIRAVVASAYISARADLRTAETNYVCGLSLGVADCFSAPARAASIRYNTISDQ